MQVKVQTQNTGGQEILLALREKGLLKGKELRRAYERGTNLSGVSFKLCKHRLIQKRYLERWGVNNDYKLTAEGKLIAESLAQKLRATRRDAVKEELVPAQA